MISMGYMKHPPTELAMRTSWRAELGTLHMIVGRVERLPETSSTYWVKVIPRETPPRAASHLSRLLDRLLLYPSVPCHRHGYARLLQ